VRYRVHVVAAFIAAAVVGLIVPGRLWSGLYALAAVALPAVLLLLGEPGRGRARRLLGAVVTTGALLTGGLAVLMWLAGGDPAEWWLLGLPAGLAIQIWGMAVAPLLVIGVLFGLDFERFSPSAHDLERIRSLADDDA
jgi:hypothetical protein